MAKQSPNSGNVFDEDRLARLVELMKVHDLAEINLKQGEQQIQMKRGSQAPVMQMAAAAAPPPLPAAQASPQAVPQETVPVDEPHMAYITSPMVGTFYTKPNPEADIFVRTGDRVDPETTICIIEAMKVFNEINADMTGEVVAVLVENEEPVEYGTRLFKIDTSK
jgi:acetyl-CoA carboxylase biotin carboxyl carrier protein